MTPNGGCHELRECINTAGSFECGPCIDGYVDDGATGCMFADPCAAGVHNCEKTEYCINHKLGEFYCEVRKSSREGEKERGGREREGGDITYNVYTNSPWDLDSYHFELYCEFSLLL